jgi:hypothetical protein
LHKNNKYAKNVSSFRKKKMSNKISFEEFKREVEREFSQFNWNFSEDRRSFFASSNSSLEVGWSSVSKWAIYFHKEEGVSSLRGYSLQEAKKKLNL